MVNRARALVFDLDGVLIDSEPLHRTTWKVAFQELNVSLSEDDENYLQGRL